MTIIKQEKTIIVELNNSGLGVCESSSKVALPYTLPGEEIIFDTHHYRNLTNYKLVKQLSFSQRRAQPDCQFFGTCGGCLLQHLNEEDYQSFKLSLITKAMDQYSISTETIRPMVIIPKHNRRRASLEAKLKGDDILLGFRRFKSNQIINISECIALLPELSNLLSKIKSILPMILADRHKATIHMTYASNGIDLIFETEDTKNITDQNREILKAFSSNNNIVRMVLIGGSKWDVIHQSDYPYIEFDGIPVGIDAHGFLQVSFAADKILAEILLKTLLANNQVDKQYKIVDLFAGRGTLTLPVSRYFQIDSFELDTNAVKALRGAGKKSGRQINVYSRDLFVNPLKWDELNKYDIAIINPPRSGALTQCKNLSVSTVKKICYISCDPVTFARDVQILTKAQWRLESVTPVDQFYKTPHLELVGILVK